jgi:flagellar biogenesis protein FliO
MDMLSLLRTLGGLGVVLGVLAGALWVVRRYDLRLPGRAVGARKRRLELVESLQIDSKRIVALVRRDGQEHLVLIAPEGHLLLETSARLDAQASAPDSALAEDAQPAKSDTVHAATESFVSSLGKLQREGPSDDIDIKSVIERLRRSASTSRALPLTLDRPVRRRAQAQVRQPLPFERERQLV